MKIPTSSSLIAVSLQVHGFHPLAQIPLEMLFSPIDNAMVKNKCRSGHAKDTMKNVLIFCLYDMRCRNLSPFLAWHVFLIWCLYWSEYILQFYIKVFSNTYRSRGDRNQQKQFSWEQLVSVFRHWSYFMFFSVHCYLFVVVWVSVEYGAGNKHLCM